MKMLILKWTFCAWNLAEENQGRTLQTNALQQQSWGQYLWHLIDILPRQDWSACINPERNHAYWGPCWCTLLLLMLLSIHLMLKFQEWSWGCLRWTQLCMPINLISTWVNWCGCCRKSSNGNHHQILSGCQLIVKKKKRFLVAASTQIEEKGKFFFNHNYIVIEGWKFEVVIWMARFIYLLWSDYQQYNFFMLTFWNLVSLLSLLKYMDDDATDHQSLVVCFTFSY